MWDLRPDSDYYFLRLNGTATYRFQYGSSVVDFDAVDNRWNHIAISRSSGTTKIFVNGIETNSFSDSTNNSTGTLRLSTFRDTTTSSSDYGFEGQLSNFRIVKGTALYTSNFTPPTEPLTNVTNTKLLCCQSNSSAVNYAVSPGTITANGDAAATNFNPFNTDINTVRGQETGYATLNPLIGNAGLTNVTLSNGNLTFANSDTSYRRYVPSNISMPLNTGKYYFEGVYTKSPDSNNAIYDSFGLIDTSKVWSRNIWSI